MSRRRLAKPPGKGVVVLAGESANDRRMLAAFIKAVHPDLAAAVTLTEITDPVRLRKKTGVELATAASVLVRKARGKAKLKSAEFVGIAVHEDMDACPGPEYDTTRPIVCAALARAADAASSVYALAAAESEAWLMLFPDAFSLHKPSWSLPPHWRSRDTGRRQNPKEDLAAELTSPRFRESDGPEIAATALAHGLLTEPSGSNRSYTEFVADLRKWEIPRTTRR
ncbi:hypothetical protein [Streptomyces sp. CAU 1734]|uniref:hypothetical protein n=1 Tax=Streptomyces sp. CAU 1734 TaxID=3140360 RepID=UPI003260D39A